MGAFFGVTSKNDCMTDVFFGTDYHSHLGTHSGGIALYDAEIGLQRKIHNLENAPFRTKFEHVFDEMKGVSALGCISDRDPQPLMFKSRLGRYAICVVGAVINEDELVEKYLTKSGHFAIAAGAAVNDTELVSALIDQKGSFTEGIAFAQDVIEGTASIAILTDGGSIIAARDKAGRLPVIIGKREDGFSISFESFVLRKLEYEPYKELSPGEIVEVTAEGVKVLRAGFERMRICSFLWTYYGYPTSCYEGVNVEQMRMRNGEILAENDKKAGKCRGIDYVCGVPDSGTPHAIGYANESKIPFARPYIKYTPTWSRSFISGNQIDRSKIAKMKQIPVRELIAGKDLLFVDDSIVRGTQLKETVEFLHENGAKTVHMRSACPPIMYGCKYLNFSRATSDMELIARRVINELEGEEGFKHIDEYSDASTKRGRALRKNICEKFGFDSLEFQSLEGMIRAIGVDEQKLCTYCWNGKE